MTTSTDLTPSLSQAEMLARVRRLQIKARRLVRRLFLGEYHSVFRGRGIEFSEVREYTPGDEVRTIDWNVTARMGTPYVKKFVEERELVLYLLVDVSASSSFSSTAATKRRQSITRALATFFRRTQDPSARLEVAMPIAIESTAALRPSLSTRPAWSPSRPCSPLNTQ